MKQCYECTYWKGDKAEVIRTFKANPISMDLFKGYPCFGACSIDYEWLDTDIYGDASVTNKVAANFGCPYWKKGI